MVDFTRRLKRAKERAKLSIKEMAVWFEDMSSQTMWTWLSGRIPKPHRREDAEKNLKFLERELDKKGSLPLALSVRQGDRQKYVARIRKSHV